MIMFVIMMMIRIVIVNMVTIMIAGLKNSFRRRAVGLEIEKRACVHIAVGRSFTFFNNSLYVLAYTIP